MTRTLTVYDLNHRPMFWRSMSGYDCWHLVRLLGRVERRWPQYRGVIRTGL